MRTKHEQRQHSFGGQDNHYIQSGYTENTSIFLTTIVAHADLRYHALHKTFKCTRTHAILTYYFAKIYHTTTLDMHFFFLKIITDSSQAVTLTIILTNMYHHETICY